MAETDLLNDLLSANPNHPASNGVVLLLRTEMKSEFRAVRSELSQIKTDIVGIKADIVGIKADIVGIKGDILGIKEEIVGLKNSIDHVAQQVAILVNRG